jgi:hypothetical protein
MTSLTQSHQWKVFIAGTKQCLELKDGTLKTTMVSIIERILVVSIIKFNVGDRNKLMNATNPLQSESDKIQHRLGNMSRFDETHNGA